MKRLVSGGSSSLEVPILLVLVKGWVLVQDDGQKVLSLKRVFS